MDDLLTYAVKGDIIKAVIKSHGLIFLSGWTKTGKTLSVVKAISEIDKGFYFSHCKESIKTALSADPQLGILNSLSDLSHIDKQECILVIDDYSTANEGLKKEIKTLIRNRPEKMKIVLIVKALVELKDLLPLAQAIVRLKNSTAEILYSNLQDRSDDD